jgi:hypothetical protein
MYGSFGSVIARGQATPNGLNVAIADASGGTGSILIVAGVIAVAGLFLARRTITVAMGAFVVASVVILAVPVLHYSRNALPVLPYVAIGVGLLPGQVGRLLARGGGGPPGTARLRRPGLATAFVTVAIALALIAPVADDIAAARRSRVTDTRTIAYTWMLDHLPHNAIVAREQYTPQVRPDQFRLRNHDGLYQRDMAWYRQQGVRYVVASSAMYDRFVDNPATPFRSAFYHELFSMPEVFRVEPDGHRSGPTIRIFELPAAGS